MARPRLAAAAAAIAVALATSAPAAAQRSIGANLNRPANAAYGCESLPTTDAFGNRQFLPTGVGTCTYLGLGRLGDQSEIPGAPGPGVVVRARVKAGPATGPVQVVVLQATGAIGVVRSACCFPQRVSQVFTPAPNAITTVPVRLPVRYDLNPDFGETRDYLGLSVLAPNVPIPAHEEGAPGRFDAPIAFGWYPHRIPGDERADGAGVTGMVPLLNVDFIGLCGAALVATTAQQQGRCAPRLEIGRTATVRRGRARIPLACNLTKTCRGELRLDSRRGGRRKRFGSASFRIASGASTTLRPRLTRAGRRLLRKRRRARVHANTRLGSKRIVLKRPR